MGIMSKMQTFRTAQNTAETISVKDKRYSLNALIKNMIPPFLFQIYANAKNYLIPLKSWQEAEEKNPLGYFDQDIANLVAFKTEATLNKNTCLYSLLDLQSISAIGIARQFCASSTFRVADIGGACGLHYFNAKRLFQETVFSWQVYETKPMIQAAEKFKSAELHFDTLPAQFNDFDLIHCSGTLGFIKESDEMLEKILNSDVPFILLARICTVVNSPQDVFVLHKHLLKYDGPGAELPDFFSDKTVAYPARLFSRQKFEEKLCRNYQIIFKVRDASAELKVKNHHTVGMTYFLRRR